MNYWEKINSPSDLKKLSKGELLDYAAAVRQHIIDASLCCGGHLASNLGTVELTIALHYVFDFPTDKLVFDVGHQCYTHKIITGRKKAFENGSLRKNGGISGFPTPAESEYDCFISGHSSNSLSLAAGMAKARQLKGENYNIVALIGDGAFTGGMVYEGLNDIGAAGLPMIIVLNDNKMSIAANVGAVSKYFSSLRLSKRYLRLKANVKKGMSALPLFGEELVEGTSKLKEGVKAVLIGSKMFESLGIKYYGPYDGHNIADMIDIFHAAKCKKKPLIIHLMTNKGRGFARAEHDPEKFHGVSPATGAVACDFGETAGTTLVEMAAADERVTAITAAMPAGTGMYIFAEKYPNRYFDVGIAEQHAVSMAAGMAEEGLKPYFAVYSTFLQRAFDQVLHDVCIRGQNVKFLIDRAGVVGADGVTHQGVFDLSYLTMLPNMTVMTPSCRRELREMMLWSLDFEGPLAIRYPKSCAEEFASALPIEWGKWEWLQKSPGNIFLIAAGSRMVALARRQKEVNVINARFVKPVDEDLLTFIDKKDNVIISLEDNALLGGFNQLISRQLNYARFYALGHPDEFIFNLDANEAMANSGLGDAALKALIDKFKRTP